jgi:two-component system sensor histidine kinase ChiS
MTDFTGKKIMLVDDDAFLLDMYALKFKNAGFDVTASVGGEEALAKLEEGYQPEIILLDIIMPKIDGLMLLDKIAENNYAKGALKIVVSNQGQQKDIEAIEGKDVAGYIIKALHTPSEVLEEVKKIYNSNSKK